MIAEDVEFQISQYADGTLSAAERPLIDDLMKADPQARQLLAEYRKLDGHLVTLRGEPAIEWDKLASHISNAIDEDQQPQVAQPQIAGRIGWVAWTSGRMRIAAGILVVLTVGLVVRRSVHTTPIVPTGAPEKVLKIEGPQAEVADGKPVDDIAVGPSKSADGSGYPTMSIVTSPSKVVIEAGTRNKPGPKSQQPH